MAEATAEEQDPRFPSGLWTGFYTDPGDPAARGKQSMELKLAFASGRMTGEGRDPVGEFTVSGRYHLDDGTANFTKQYVRRHAVEYSGFNEGKGIWGTWTIKGERKGGFHIWPEAMGDPNAPQELAEELEPPDYKDPNPSPAEEDEELVPAG